MTESSIGWCTYTLNMHAGCRMVGPECTNCYAQRLAVRLEAMGQPHYQGLTTRNAAGKALWNGQVNEAGDKVTLAAFQEKPQVMFVDSMSDIFFVPEAMFLRAFSVMASNPQHVFMLLTKRPDTAVRIIQKYGIADRWPDHLWIGVSVGVRDSVGRIDILRDIPARFRFISAEPLIEDIGRINLTGIDLLIGGGESPNPSYRRCDPNWMRSLRDQCGAAGTAFFLKQWGHPSNNHVYNMGIKAGVDAEVEMAQRQGFTGATGRDWPHGGCSLDGRIWLQVPEPARSILTARGKMAEAAPDGIDLTWKRRRIDEDLRAGLIMPGTAAARKAWLTRRS